ncbi:MAG: gliding motility-associated C-terminal domain-containing protein [Bacteroidetes bacterium]|nr:gliding motility-associated C-terminal domain-containing protein [Bacteroidota bacterium]
MYNKNYFGLMNCWVFTLLFLMNCPTVFGQTFTGSGGNIPGTGSSPTCFNNTVSGVGVINSTKGLEEVCLTITHPSIDELEILLQSPDGIYVPLSIQNGAAGADNYTNTCFKATAISPVKFNTAPFTGTFLPEGHLGAVNNGQNANGIWKLCILDRRNNSNAGTLNSWSIKFSNNPAPQPPDFPNCSTTIPLNVDCSNATPICDFNGACGKTTGTKKSWTALDNASCFGLNNNSFVKFIANSSTVSFSVWVNSSTSGFNNVNGGIQMLFLSTPSCGGSPVNTFGCYNRIYPYPPSGKPLISIVYATGLTPGNTYYLMTDGANGDVCEFHIAANSGINALNISTPGISTGGTPEICLGQTINLSATGGNGTYSWSNVTTGGGLLTTSGSSVSAIPAAAGEFTYRVTSSTGLGCPASKEIKVKVNALPGAPAATPTSPSCNSSTGSITVAPQAGVTYSINGGTYVSNNVFTGLNPGNYNVTVKNSSDCVSNPISVTINNPPSAPGLVYSIIDPTCTKPTGSVVIQTPTGSDYEFQIDGGSFKNQSDIEKENLVSGAHTLIARDISSGCVTPVSSFNVPPAPIVPADPVYSITQPDCATPAGSITLNTVADCSYSINGINYQISNVFTSLTPGNYTVSLKHNNSGCESKKTAVTINPFTGTIAPPVVSIVQPTCSLNTGTISINPVAGYTYSIDGISYQTGSVFGGLSAGNYNVTVKNLSGCTSGITPATITGITCLDDLFAPNAFTPNGDGKNDVWLVKGTSIQSIQVIIFNQWGEKVFESNRIDQGWDGKSGGKDQPVGVYVYTFQVTLNDGRNLTKQGSITLIR